MLERGDIMEAIRIENLSVAYEERQIIENMS